MRLINADKVKEYILKEGFYCDTKADKEAIAKEFDLLFPTVKAIPIEWLHSIMEKQIIFAMNSDGNIYFISAAIVRQVLENVIELWEKENEENN